MPASTCVALAVLFVALGVTVVVVLVLYLLVSNSASTRFKSNVIVWFTP